MPRATVQTTIRVEPDVYEQAQEKSRREGVSLNEWITRLIRAALGKKEE